MRVQAAVALAAVALVPLAPDAAAASDAEPEAAPAARMSIVYTGEWWRVSRALDGSGSRYLDNLDLTVEVDGARMWGIEGLTLFGYLLYNNGRSVGALAGDAQGLSNIEADEALRLYELWAQWRFGVDHGHSTRVGLYDLNSEFDALPSAGLFVNSSHGIGADFAQSGLNGPSIFPATSLAVRYRYDSAAGWSILGAVLDGVPGDPQRPKRTAIRLSDRDGLLWVAEASLQRARLTKIAAGLWGYTARFDDLLLTDAAGEPLRRRGNRGYYAQAELALVDAPVQDAAPRLSGFLRWGRADADFNRFGGYLGAGLVWRSVLGAESGDELGLAVAQARNGTPWRVLQGAAGSGTTRGETAIELTWRLPVNDWLTLQPDLQWIRDPDTDPTRRAVFGAALRFEIAAERTFTRAGARR